MTTSERRPVFAFLGLVLVLALAAAVRFWNLGAHDFGNIYYAAAVRSMAERWSNCLYASFDPAGVVTLDKPPAAFWVQVLSVKLFGYSGIALHLPQALLGVANVLLVYRLARRISGAWAGVTAALVMAVFPAAIAADRSNLPDTFLLFVSLLAVAALLRTIETRRWGWLLVSAVLVGVGFTTKMIVAWMILPALALAYLISGPRSIGIRAAHLMIAGILVIVTSLAWPIAVDLTPTNTRPYIGGTTRNSAIERALGGFGLERLIGRGPPGSAPRGPRAPGPPMGPADGPPAGPFSVPPGGPSRHLTGHGGMPSVLRLGNRDLAGHGSWLFPFAVLGAITALRIGGTSRTSLRAASLALWTTWLVTFAVVFSAASGPIHPYYLIMLGPPIAIFVGVGAAAMLPRRDEPSLFAFPASPLSGGTTGGAKRDAANDLLAARVGRAIAAVALSAIAQVLILGHTPEWGRWLVPVILVGCGTCILALVIAWRKAKRGTAVVGLAIGFASLFISPTIWSLMPALAGGGRMVPIADPQMLESRRDPDEVARNRAAIRALVDYLQRGAGRASFFVASADIHLAAPLIIETGVRAIAYGGFQGNDPAIRLEQFTELVGRRELRYVLLARGRGLGRMGPPRGNDPIATWVREHGVEVPSAAWLPRELAAGPPREMNMMAGDTAGMFRNLYRSGALSLIDCGVAGGR